MPVIAWVLRIGYGAARWIITRAAVRKGAEAAATAAARRALASTAVREAAKRGIVRKAVPWVATAAATYAATKGGEVLFSSDDAASAEEQEVVDLTDPESDAALVRELDRQLAIAQGGDAYAYAGGSVQNVSVYCGDAPASPSLPRLVSQENAYPEEEALRILEGL